MTASFKFRMLYAPCDALVKAAAKGGMDWVVVESYGHKNLRRQGLDDVYVPFRNYPGLRAYQKKLEPYYKERIAQTKKLVALAKKSGLKTAIHGYEISLPAAIRDACPEVFTPPVTDGISAFYTFAPPPKNYRAMCLSNPALRRMITSKIRELFELIPGLDGYIYSFHETSGTGFAHRCPFCRDIPYWRMFQYLHDAIREGLDQVDPRKKLFVRCWGTQESVQTRKREYLQLFQAGRITKEQKRYWERMVSKYGFYDPKKEIPLFIKSLAGKNTAFIYKATWADFSIRQPANPWMGAYAPHDEIAEVSFEHCRHGSDHFLVLPQQIPGYVRMADRKNLAGVCGVPFNWGSSVRVNPDYAFDPERWKLNKLNLDLFMTCARRPSENAEEFVRKWLKNRYGHDLPALAKLLLSVEQTTDQTFNLNGVAPQDVYGVFGYSYVTLDYLKHILNRYLFLRKDGLQRVSRSPENLERINENHRRGLERIKSMLVRIERLKNSIPRKAAEDFRECFSNWHDMLRFASYARQAALLAWGMEEGRLKPSPKVSGQLQQWQQNLCQVVAESPLIRKIILGSQVTKKI